MRKLVNHSVIKKKKKDRLTVFRDFGKVAVILTDLRECITILLNNRYLQTYAGFLKFFKYSQPEGRRKIKAH